MGQKQSAQTISIQVTPELKEKSAWLARQSCRSLSAYVRPQKRACCKMCSSYKDPSFREKRPPTGRPFFVGIRPFCRGNGLPRQCAHWLAMTGLCKTAILQQALFHNMAYSPTTAAQRGHSSA